METENQPVAAPTSDELEIDLLGYWNTLRKRLWSAVAIFAVVLGVTVLWTLRQPHIYQGTATIDIEPSAPQVLGSKIEDVVDPGGNGWYSHEYYETQYKIINSRAVAQRAVDKLALAEDPKFLGVDGIHDPAARKQAMAGADAVALLQGLTTVEPVKDSHLVLVHVEDPDPQQAALLANTLAQAYIDENAEQRQQATRNAVSWLQSQVSGIKGTLEGSELALYSYKRENDMLSMSLEDQQNTTSMKLKTLADDITKAQVQRIQVQAQMDQLRKLQDEGKRTGEFTADSFGPVVESEIVQSLKSSYLKQKQAVAELSARYESKHPKLVEAQAQLASIRDDLQHEIDHIVEASELNFRSALQAETQLEKLYDQVRTEAFNVNKKELDYQKLERDSKNTSDLYDMVLKRLKETDLTSLLKTNNVHLLDPAIVPTSPIKPSRTKNALIAALIGAVLGIGFAFLLERLDNTFKGQADVERILGLVFLGILPSIEEEAGSAPVAARELQKDIFIHTHPKSSVAECCRSIRTNLLFMSPDRPLRRLLVTSSGPQEGKTTTAVSLGIAMAQSGNRVLLVDTDMRRPRLHRAFGVSNELGLSNTVVGETQLEQCIKTTEVPNLSVLPCGPLPPNPAELLHAERFSQIVHQLSERFDRVIFDSPPLGAVADAVVLATQVDGTLLVLKAGKTTYEVARRAVDALSSVNAPVAGAILNDLDLESREYGYYYYYYRRGYYGEEQPKTS